MAALKEHLNTQEIVSKQLMREIVRMKTSDINRTKRMTYTAAAFCLIVYPLTAEMHMWSWAFALATCAMMIFCILGTYLMHRPVDQLNLAADNLATVTRVMARFKKQYNQWLYYVSPALLIPWFAWLCYEVGWKYAPEGVSPVWMLLPMFIGLIIGALIGIRYHLKATNAAQNIIDQIEDIQHAE